MQQLARIFVIAGVVMIALGAVFYLAGRFNLPLGRLPGDIRVEREGFKVYFPVVTCILISIILTLIMWLLRKR